MINYDFRCEACNYTFEDMVKYVDRDKYIKCEMCGEEKGKRYYGTMPGTLVASFPDGYKRPGWADLKEDAKLQEALAHARSEDEKTTIHKEITDRFKKK